VEPRVQEKSHNDGEVSIDISGNPITNDYATIDTIQRRHQAGDYSGWTGMGDGILKARELLVGMVNDPDDPDDIGYSRFGARPTMLIMRPTVKPTKDHPVGACLATLAGRTGPIMMATAAADYTTSDWKKQYSFWEATQAIELGIKLLTTSY
jgi:hypothetical protein